MSSTQDGVDVGDGSTGTACKLTCRVLWHQPLDSHLLHISNTSRYLRSNKDAEQLGVSSCRAEQAEMDRSVLQPGVRATSSSLARTDRIEGTKALVPAILLDPVNTRRQQLSLQLPLGHILLVGEHLPLLALAVRDGASGQQREQPEMMRAELGVVRGRGREGRAKRESFRVVLHRGIRCRGPEVGVSVTSTLKDREGELASLGQERSGAEADSDFP
jgi:hypothetical protein